jgi:hypothetical protein
MEILKIIFLKKSEKQSVFQEAAGVLKRKFNYKIPEYM